MREVDDWGRDPAVRRTRVLFGQMEQTQGDLLARAGVSPFDGRLRAWREEALARFQRSWRGSGESEAAAVYRDCLTQVLADGGVEVPASALPTSERWP